MHDYLVTVECSMVVRASSPAEAQVLAFDEIEDLQAATEDFDIPWPFITAAINQPIETLEDVDA